MRRPDKMCSYTADDAYNDAYATAIGNACLNRKERRTAKGKLQVAKAEIAALNAKLKYLEENGDKEDAAFNPMGTPFSSGKEAKEALEQWHKLKGRGK